ncbi:ribonuclease HI family protein [Candidatus Babeliales bacterium]|nr:ribonuclease HI family protein [Candidatus Babeliales bacterium]
MEKQTTFLKEKNKLKKQNNPDKWEIFVDGASRGNPGPAGAGIYIKHREKDIFKGGMFLKKKTNNQAEYLALAIAIFIFKEKFLKKKTIKTQIIITSDSELLIKQMTGTYKVKNPILFKIKILIDSMLENLKYKFKHVLREKNKIADKLANYGIDKQKNIPIKFVKLLEKHEIYI